MQPSNRDYVGIIDFGMGNLFSVKQACERVGLRAVISSQKEDIAKACAVILPGVGAFGDAMMALEKLDLVNFIKDFILSGKQFMGICLGMQLLMSESEEFGTHRGLNIIPGSVVKFSYQDKSKVNIKVPQVGWNGIFKNKAKSALDWQQSPLADICEGEFMYFIHSYYCVLKNESIILSRTRYADIEYCSSFLWKNIYASQFHPEKSAAKGLKIYQNWASLIKRERTLNG